MRKRGLRGRRLDDAKLLAWGAVQRLPSVNLCVWTRVELERPVPDARA